ncbi:MAG: Flp pilus assembly complex ATPase component TadA [Gemmatimonadetes bacterium]|jgi:type II secretory ATPase GspE/PulE/Tfp pilus assembly ATPase PilB-like protein|nr:Flp pilus assembly complex ATPase component TadA [Gemmatimonadota bacterium]MBK7831920.1 Flp pilus assembly complex ATPase component TadA [Gemmatimonadota bacterium]MBK8648547.1 Flp pilus assembly complex ATPase component TadA [Gemmatimonadota bacterium]MBK9976922.1 Flp pilus assembly complex ATPase component TadA [Gemmatimonadota bacterium]MCC7324163.1 Flp pilus assembly complex ATPase component TadA [Gemmatimonadaceae bacterium]
MSSASGEGRAPRKPWGDRWLLDAFRERGHPLADSVQAAATAWESLTEAGVPNEEIVRVVCDLAGVRAADLSLAGPELAELLTATLALRYDVVPVRLDGKTLEVATANPLGNHLERDLAFASARRIRVSVAAPVDIREARERIYQQSGAPSSANSRVSWIVQQNPHAPTSAPTRGVAVDTLDRIVLDAIDQRSSDIHLEPTDGELAVRFRVDGVLHDVMRVPADVTPLLLSRLKVSAGLDIANRLRPQDGRAAMVVDGRPVDLRISTLPLGERMEKAVIRILDASATALDFAALGFTDEEQAQLTRILHSNEGMVLVTGPTGSGKTTTLYSALMHLKSRETNIVTVEDPIEYRLEGVNQVQVHEKAGLSFAAALRSILRQDPDVVLVGEVRDVETASIAIRASMTGHMVLSTLHTNDAPSAIGRLADMGVDMSALAGALKAVIAQRLVRRLCPQCSVPVRVGDLPLELQWIFEGRDTEQLRGPLGCAACRGTGFRGRMAIAEMLVIDEETQQLMARSTQRLEFLQLARRQGMHTLWETGLERVLQGQTSFQELTAHITPPIPESDLKQGDVDRLLSDLLGGGAGPVEREKTPVSAAVAIATPVTHTERVPATGGPPLAVSRAVPTVAPYRQIIAPRGANVGAPRVLVVHDVRERRRSVRKALERAGCIVLEAADGESGLSFACRLRPDAIVSEVVLPKLDGIALLQLLRAEGVVEHIFFYTDQRDERLLNWAADMGASDILTVDDDLETLATRVMAEFPEPGRVEALRAS